jgi:hypothetical protein
VSKFAKYPTKNTRQRIFAEPFAGVALPSAALGKAFAECFLAFAENILY